MEEFKNKKTKTKPEIGHKMSFIRRPSYYFHADEDFREDWQWGKVKKQQSQSK